MPFSAFALIAILTLVVVIFAVNFRREAERKASAVVEPTGDRDEKHGSKALYALEPTEVGAIVTPMDPMWGALNVGEAYTGEIPIPAGSYEDTSRFD